MRPINEFLKTLRRAQGWSYLQESEAMGGGISAQSLELHDENDSGNGYVIARRLELYCKNPPTRKSATYADGTVCQIVDRDIREANLDNFSVARQANLRMRMKLDTNGIQNLAEQIRNVRRGRSQDCFVIGLIDVVLGEPTIDPYMHLKKQDREPQPKQLKLVFGGTYE